MKVELKIGTDCDDLEIHELYINGNEVERIQDLSECPEDAHIGRDLVDGNDIIKYMMLAYEAGKNGEPLEISYGEIEE